MSEGWAAVAREISARAAELGLNQKELAARSGVSLAIVREIQQDRIRRRRNPRTLEALSLALQRHPQYLTAILDGKQPPSANHTASFQSDAVLVALNAIAREIRGLRAQVGTLAKRIDAALPRDDDRDRP